MSRMIDIREVKKHVRLLKNRFPDLDVADITAAVHDAHMEYDDHALCYTAAYRSCIKLLRRPKGVIMTSIDVMIDQGAEWQLNEHIATGASAGSAGGRDRRLVDNTTDFETILRTQPPSVRLLADIAVEEAARLSLAGHAIWDFGAIPFLQGVIRDRFVAEVGCSRQTYYNVRRELVKMLRKLN